MNQPAAAPPEPQNLKDLEQLLYLMTKYEASDMHLKVHAPPIMRISGKVRSFDAPPFDADTLRRMVREILDPVQQREFDGAPPFDTKGPATDMDFAYSIPGVGRYRFNVFKQRGTYSVAVRRVNNVIPTMEKLNLPGDTLREISQYRDGLVVVCGVTGSGKSTTLAAMMEHINQNRRTHIVTIEDPIEFLYTDNKSFINQREIGLDCPDFERALKSVVRQDPDVILLGELRDAETFESALMASETGHLVFGTLHSSSVSQTMGRILELFPPERERSIRLSLRFNLRAVICQKILPSCAEGVGRVPCQEILIANPTVAKMIHEGKDKQLEGVIRGSKEEGMQDFNQSLMVLVQKGLITEEVALEASPNSEQLQMNLRGIFLGEDRGLVG